MNSPISAMDTCFSGWGGDYSLDAQLEILADLGYDGLHYSCWDSLSWERLEGLEARARAKGVAITSVYHMANLSELGTQEARARLASRLSVAPAASLIELAMRDGDHRSDDLLVLLKDLLRHPDLADRRLALYPHVATRVETVGHARELAESVGDDRLGVAFGAYHWAATGGTDLEKDLHDVGPMLFSVNLSGLSRDGTEYCIHRVGDGEFDAFWLLSRLRSIGYSGPLAVQGFGVGGDAYAALRQSLAAVRDAAGRAARQPEWGSLERRGQ